MVVKLICLYTAKLILTAPNAQVARIMGRKLGYYAHNSIVVE